MNAKAYHRNLASACVSVHPIASQCGTEMYVLSLEVPIPKSSSPEDMLEHVFAYTDFFPE